MTKDWTSNNYLTGRDQEKPVIEFTAGPVTGIFDPNIGFLRQVRLGDHELIRGIYMAVRDSKWKTLPIELEIIEQNIDIDHFEIQFRCSNKLNDAEFEWTGKISGDDLGNLEYAFTGTAQTTFERMRLGLCLLHAENECAGKELKVTHTKGEVENTQFSYTVAPIAPEPVIDIKELEYEAAPNVRVKFLFQGDIFEMEDQRNWTDASYKTYCTPASLPRPVTVQKEDMVSQSIRMELSGETKKIFPILIGRDPQFNISTTPVLPIPPIGTNVSPEAENLSDSHKKLLKRLQLSHLRADLLPEDPKWEHHLKKLASQSRDLDLPVYLAITHPDPTQDILKKISSKCDELSLQVQVVQLIGQRGKVLSEEQLNSLLPILPEIFPNASFATGSDKDFAQVNASRHLASSQLHPVYGICPQVHAFDNLTLVENLSCQSRGVECLEDWWQQTPMISSVHLHRYPGAKALYDAETACKEYDTRHPSLFAAAWTVGSLSKLIETGNTHSLTYYETTGKRGLLADINPDSIPADFRCSPENAYPLYFIFEAIAGYSKALKMISSHTWETLGMTLLDEKNKRLFIVSNYLGKELDVKIKSGTCSTKIKVLSESNVTEVVKDPEQWFNNDGEALNARGGKLHLSLPPYATVFIKEV